MNNHLTDALRIRSFESNADIDALVSLYDDAFGEEGVGILARTLYHHYPFTADRYWFLAEHLPTQELVAALTLLPWTIEMDGTRLKVAEMGIVGTRPAWRGQGIQRNLNAAFENVVAAEGFAFVIIQGIPRFYDQFGYAYALPLENHLNVQFGCIPRIDAQPDRFRLASQDDIPYLISQDELYRRAYTISAVRDVAHWGYLLTDSKKTEYGSEFWILSHEDGEFVFRIPQDGFGEGLIISEVSETITHRAFVQVLVFCKNLAEQRNKPYLRFNLHNDSRAGKLAQQFGAKIGTPYAWQIKIPNLVQFFHALAPVLERRMVGSAFTNWSGALSLNVGRETVVLQWVAGTLKEVVTGKQKADLSFSMASRHFAPFVLGHRTWQELHYVWPDIFPSSTESAHLVETLFPKTNSWIHQQY